jgi:hypothetical protein
VIFLIKLTTTHELLSQIAPVEEGRASPNDPRVSELKNQVLLQASAINAAKEDIGRMVRLYPIDG